MFVLVEVPGFEPGISEPKSLVLPLHYTSLLIQLCAITPNNLMIIHSAIIMAINSISIAETGVIITPWDFNNPLEKVNSLDDGCF